MKLYAVTVLLAAAFASSVAAYPAKSEFIIYPFESTLQWDPMLNSSVFSLTLEFRS